jgi:hypothetical protein
LKFITQFFTENGVHEDGQKPRGPRGQARVTNNENTRNMRKDREHFKKGNRQSNEAKFFDK